MKILQFIKSKTIPNACIYAILIDAALLLVSMGAENIIASLTAYVFFAILIFSLVLSIIDSVYCIPKINTVLKTLIHFVLCTGVYFVFLKAVLEYDEKNKLTQLGVDTKKYIVGGIIFIIIYALVMTVKLSCSAIAKKREEKKNKEYEDMF